MKKNILSVLILVWVYLGMVSILRIFQNGGSGDWHRMIYSKYGTPFINWWWMIIPAIALFLGFRKFTSSKIQNRALIIFSAATIFFIVATYI